jgi:hypothetical protein
LYPARFVSGEPSLFVVGGVQESVAEPRATACTVRLNAGSDALKVPSLALMTMPLVAPMCCKPGVPESRPVAGSNVAQAGAFVMLNVTVLPSGSLAVGVKLYDVPCMTAVPGVPVIVGARFDCVTAIANGASAVVSWPSLTLILMFANEPTLAAAGVPCSRPVDAVNVAHVGRLTMLKVSVPPFASLAVGVNVYCVPTVAVVGGVPEIVGGVLDDATVIENAGSAADALPSLTLMTMLLYVRMWDAPGVPCSAPVLTLNVAHVGRFAIANLNVLPSASAAVGWNTYAVPCLAVVAGVPEIVGARLLVATVTAIANAGSEAVAVPSLTEITMLPKVPDVPAGGVPASLPKLVSNVAQAGRPVIENVNESPSGSPAVGTNW